MNDSTINSYSDYIELLYKQNPQFCINRTAYINYINYEEGPHESFNAFCDSTIGIRYIKNVTRQKKLERLIEQNKNEMI